MSDSDDIPELATSSSDEETSGPEEDESEKQNEMQAETWLKRDHRVLERQDTWFRVFCLGPYLYGVDSILPRSWMQALSSARLLLNKHRQQAITYLQWEEWDCLDLMDNVVVQVQMKMRDQPTLAQALRCVQLVDNCITGNSDDVDRAIRCAETVQHVTSLWATLMKPGKERATKFAVLYAIKIYSQHVLKFDFVDGTKKNLKKNTNQGSKTADELKRDGNNHFKNTKLKEAIVCYSDAAKKDPFHHVYYGNRAQAYNRLNQFNEALADGRRAVTIKPDFAKGYYRYAVAFHELGRLDSAIAVIAEGIDQCLSVKDIDLSNLDELKNLKYTYTHQKSQNAKHLLLTAIPKDLDEQLAALPSDDIELEEKFGVKKPKHDTPEDEVPPMVSSDTDSEEKQQQLDKKSRKKTKTKQKARLDNKDTKKKEMLKTASLANGKLANGIDHVQAEKEKNEKSARRKELEELTSYLADGSDSLLKKADKMAMISYQKAIDMLNHAKPEDLELDETDVVTLKYACGMAAISTGLHKNIVDGIEKFEDILQNHQDVRFPPAYLGLGRAYVTLNRFSEAMDYVRLGIKTARSVSYMSATWPGCKSLIEDTDPDTLLGHLEKLLQQCKCPPQPDAVCRYHTDSDDDRTVIYLSDPDFKGYVKILCAMDCIITFHNVCWKTFKAEHNKQTDKDMLDTECPTPDCAGVIIRIEIIRQDSLSNKEHISERYTELKEANKVKSKPVMKQKSGEAKQARKHEKKEARKQSKKRHLQEERDDKSGADQMINPGERAVIVDGASASAFVEELIPEEQTLPDVKDTVVYKKDEPGLSEKSQSKGKRSKRKKDKMRQVINMEVNFSDRKDETLHNENAAIIDGETSTSSGVSPFSVPTDLKTQISTFEKSYVGISKPQFKPDEITENLFSFFVDILTASGPVAVDDPKIEQELDVFPSQALEKIRQVGGLADFLRQSLKFAVIDDVVSLMSDAVQAREYALKRRNKLLKEGGPPVTQTAWQTVGKSANTVDSLSESVSLGTSASFPVASQELSPSFNTKHSTIETSNSSNSNSNRSSPSIPLHLPTLPQPRTLPTMPEQTTLPTMPQPQARAWSAFVKSPAESLSGESRSPGLDALDSIEDTPVQRETAALKSRQINELDDFETISDSGSEYGKQRCETGANLGNKLSGEGGLVSNNSSRSDLSEKSLKSEFSADQMPKPLRPLNTIGGLGGLNRAGLPQKNSQMWDKLESDFDSQWNKTKKEEYIDTQSAESVGAELRHATEEFVRKSDEKFVSELAESVVDKMYTGKKVSKDEKQKTLQKVSSEIWKDFEKSANTGKFFGGDMWANTPAGGDYSANMGKFANDFMKKHYENLEDGLSPDMKTFYPPKPKSPLDGFLASQTSSHFPSSGSPSWPGEDHFSSDIIPAPPTSASFPSLSATTATSSAPPLPPTPVATYPGGYNLFSGPSWGLDSFNKPVASTSHPNFHQPPPPLFVRPPHPATSYYQSVPMSMPMGVPPPFQPPFNPLNAPGMPSPAQFRVEKMDKDVQCSVRCRVAETMTEPYEPFKQEFLLMKEERDQTVKRMMEAKGVYEKIMQQFKSKEQQVKLLENQLAEEIHKYTVEKKRHLEERELMTGEIIQLKEILTSKTASEKDLRDKMTGQEHRVSEIARLAKEQREKDLGEINRYKEFSDAIQQQFSEQLERARTAEIDILKGRLHNDKGRLSRSQKEANYHVQHLAVFVKKHQEDKKAVPPHLQGSYDYWHLVQEKIDEGLKIVQSKYEQRMQEIREGKLLSELQSVRIPSPPPMPDYLKSIISPSNSQGMNSFMVPRMPGPGGASFNYQTSPPGLTPGLTGSFPALPSSAPAPAPIAGPPPRPANQRNNNTVAVASMPGPLSQPPRPLSGARAPLATPNRAPLRPLGAAAAGGAGAGPAQKSSFEKLMQKLQSVYPNLSRAAFGQLIKELRKECGGSLSGMTMEDIVSKIEGYVNHKTAPPTAQSNSAPRAVQPPPPGLSASWAFHVARGKREVAPPGVEVFEDEEDPCVICHEEMEPQGGNKTVTLECHHRFHDECIRKWFQEQSTCPNCRVHTLLADEFPSLG